MAISEAAKKAIWIQHFLYSIGKEAIYNMALRPLTTICEDNQGVIKFVFHGLTLSQPSVLHAEAEEMDIQTPCCNKSNSHQ